MMHATTAAALGAPASALLAYVLALGAASFLARR
jgi:hypothetical protein